MCFPGSKELTYEQQMEHYIGQTSMMKEVLGTTVDPAKHFQGLLHVIFVENAYRLSFLEAQNDRPPPKFCKRLSKAWMLLVFMSEHQADQFPFYFLMHMRADSKSPFIGMSMMKSTSLKFAFAYLMELESGR
jgi:hypothetical protein